MISLALVTEGVTDQAVLEQILEEYYSHHLTTDVFFSPIQPLRDATDCVDEAQFGGWYNVLEFCASGENLIEAFSTNDYVVIQIDTDCYERFSDELTLSVSGQDKDTEYLNLEVISFLISLIGEETYRRYADQFIFAICVHSIEDWLLPCYIPETKKADYTKNCKKRLDLILSQKNTSIEKNYDDYLAASKELGKMRTLIKACNRNQSLHYFIHSLPLPSS